VVVALTACGGGGGGAGATPNAGLVVNWASLSGAPAAAGTQADPIHLAYPPLGVSVSASRGGVAQQFNLAADSSCTAVYVATNSQTTSVISTAPPDPSSPAAVGVGAGSPGLYDVSWVIVSSSKGACTITLTTANGVTAKLQVYSEM
jgi:hypothetical protein